MNFAQRALLYVSRKKGKTLGLFLLNFTVAVFLVSSFGVLNASKMLSRDIRTSFGAAFYIRAKTEILMNDSGETEVKESGVNITQNAIDEIMKTGGIACCNPVNYGFARSDDIRFIPGDGHTPESDMGALTALSFSALAPNFSDKTAVLIAGNHITESCRGIILISERLASANHLSVGDYVTLIHAKLGEMDGEYIDEIPVKTAFVQVEVAGIYRVNVEDTAPKPTAGLLENGIYASLDVLNELKESKAGFYTGEVGFYITDPAELDGIIRRVRSLKSIDWTTHFIRTNDFHYSQIADELLTLSRLMKALLVCVSAVGTAVLVLMLTLCIRGRMREVGILLAAGISKGEILAQFLLEVLSVTAISLIFSHAASMCVSELLERTLFGELLDLLNKKNADCGSGGRQLHEARRRKNFPDLSVPYGCGHGFNFCIVGRNYEAESQGNIVENELGGYQNELHKKGGFVLHKTAFQNRGIVFDINCDRDIFAHGDRYPRRGRRSDR